jgi:hypothetical protein
LPSQSAQPDEQVGVHTPAVQPVVPLLLLHSLPHAPQSAVVFSCVSQPFATLPSQLPQPAWHEIEQLPITHEGVPFVALQAVPQAPQLEALVCRLTSQPLAT